MEGGGGGARERENVTAVIRRATADSNPKP
jgi:hypothetical protein